MIEIKPLSWDSDFFGFKVGEISNLKDLTEDCLVYAQKEQYKLLYVLDNQFISSSICLSNKFHLKLVDTKVVYSKKVSFFKDSINCRLLTLNDDINDLYLLSFESGKYSRFNIDNNIGKHNFERLYRQWVDNSIRKIISDDIFVFEDQSRIIGFCTVKYHKENSRIGLIAVSPSYQGRGIGKDLILRTEYESLKRGCRFVDVATQLSNRIACGFYEKLNFNRKEMTNIYHIWL